MIASEGKSREEKELDKKKDQLLANLDKEAKKMLESQDDLTNSVKDMKDAIKDKMVQTVMGFTNIKNEQMCYFMENTFPSNIRNTE